MEGEVIAFTRLNWSRRGFRGLLVNNDFGLTWFVWRMLSAGLPFPLGCVAINRHVKKSMAGEMKQHV